MSRRSQKRSQAASKGHRNRSPAEHRGSPAACRSNARQHDPSASERDPWLGAVAIKASWRGGPYNVLRRTSPPRRRKPLSLRDHSADDAWPAPAPRRNCLSVTDASGSQKEIGPHDRVDAALRRSRRDLTCTGRNDSASSNPCPLLITIPPIPPSPLPPSNPSPPPNKNNSLNHNPPTPPRQPLCRTPPAPEPPPPPPPRARGSWQLSCRRPAPRMPDPHERASLSRGVRAMARPLEAAVREERTERRTGRRIFMTIWDVYYNETPKTPTQRARTPRDGAFGVPRVMFFHSHG
jgi:hypothetical protein